MAWRTSSEYLGQIRVSESWVQGQGHDSEKNGSVQLNNCWSEFAGSWSQYDLECLTFDIDGCIFIFLIQVLSSEVSNFVFGTEVHL